MGTPAHAYIRINFAQQTPNEFLNNEGIRDALTAFHAFKNDGEECNVFIEDAKWNSVLSTFQMNSERSQNLQFQINLLVEYLKEKKYKIDEFDSSAYMIMEDACLWMDGDEFEEE